MKNNNFPFRMWEEKRLFSHFSFQRSLCEKQIEDEMRSATYTFKTNESQHLSSQIQSLTINDIQSELLKWLSKIRNITQWNDFARSDEFAKFIENSKKVIAKSHLQKFELKILFKRRNDDLLQKIIFRQRLRVNHDKLKLIKKNADRAIVDKKKRRI